MKGLAPLLRLSANAPDLDEGTYHDWFAVLEDENVTAEELGQAAFDIAKKENFFPSPAQVIEAIGARRRANFIERQQRETADRIRERQESFRALDELPAPEHPGSGDFAPMEGLEVPPPRDPRPARDITFGPVRLLDGRLDPRWPEIKGREPAWRRKARYDSNLCSYEAANAPTAADAKRLADPVQTHITGVKRLL